MNIQDYYVNSEQDLSFTRRAASTFAKEVAGDFNPIHDEDARRFVVPGDLLFAVVLSIYGLASHTTVAFEGMVNDGSVLTLPPEIEDRCVLTDARGKSCLSINYSDKPVNNPEFVSRLISQYVRFSGQTFPDILVNLMQSKNMMINPARPLVIYKDMSIKLDRLDAEDIELKFDGASLAVDGKKGEAHLNFLFESRGKVIGSGRKTMLLGGLRPYEQSAIDEIVAKYNAAKAEYKHNIV